MVRMNLELNRCHSTLQKWYYFIVTYVFANFTVHL